jgi:hypothetical protein
MAQVRSKSHYIKSEWVRSHIVKRGYYKSEKHLGKPVDVCNWDREKKRYSNHLSHFMMSHDIEQEVRMSHFVVSCDKNTL